MTVCSYRNKTPQYTVHTVHTVLSIIGSISIMHDNCAIPRRRESWNHRSHARKQCYYINYALACHFVMRETIATMHRSIAIMHGKIIDMHGNMAMMRSSIAIMH
jgi:hypothetical protein